MRINQDSLLVYIRRLSKLETVGGDVYIQGNTALLIFLEGLSDLTEIGGRLESSQKPSLFELGREDVASPDSLTSAPYVLIRDNPSLNSYN